MDLTPTNYGSMARARAGVDTIWAPILPYDNNRKYFSILFRLLTFYILSSNGAEAHCAGVSSEQWPEHWDSRLIATIHVLICRH